MTVAPAAAARRLDARRQAQVRVLQATAADRRARLPAAARCLRERFGADVVYLFGSLVSGRQHSGSDVDLAVEELAPGAYFPALAALAQILDCDVDLVELTTADRSFAARIRREGERL